MFLLIKIHIFKKTGNIFKKMFLYIQREKRYVYLFKERGAFKIMFNVKGAANLAKKILNSSILTTSQKTVKQEGIGLGVSKQQDNPSLPKADISERMQELQAKQASLQAELAKTQNATQNDMQDNQIKRGFQSF